MSSFGFSFDAIWPPTEKSHKATITFLVVAVALVCRLLRRRETTQKAKKIIERRLDNLREGQKLLLEDAQRKDKESPETESISKDWEEGLPEASRVMGFLWDDAYEQPTTRLGLRPDADHTAVKHLFNRSLRAELMKAKVFTSKARELEREGVIGTCSKKAASCGSVITGGQEDWLKLHATNLEELRDYLGGEKLQEVMEIADDAKKNLGKKIFEKETQDLLSRCKGFSKSIQHPRKFVMAMISGIAFRVAPLWVFSNIFFLIHILGWTEFDRVLFTGEIGLKPLRPDGTYDCEMGFQLACNCLLTCAVWWIAHALTEFFIQRTTTKSELLLKSQLVECLLFQDYAYFETHDSGNLQALVNQDAQDVSENLFQLPKDMLSAFTMIVVKLIACFQIAPASLVWQCLAPIPFVAYMNKKMMDYGGREEKRASKIRDQVSAHIDDVLDNVRTVRTFANEAREVSRFQGYVEQQAFFSEFANSMQTASISAFIFCITASVAWSTYLAGKGVATGEMQAADVTIFSINMLHQVHLWQNFFNVFPRVRKMMRPVNRVINLLKSESKIEPSPNNSTRGTDVLQVTAATKSELDHILKKLETVETSNSGERFKTVILSKVGFSVDDCSIVAGSRMTSIVSPHSEEPQAVPCLEHLQSLSSFPVTLHFSQQRMPSRLIGKIQFQNVKFHYPTDLRKQVLSGLSFQIKPGQKVGICGSAGCGKSTTMDLLQRLYDVDAGSGAIYLDGVDIRQYNVHFLRQRIGVVAQKTVLFKCTVRENIWYGMESDPGDAAVEEALKQAQAWEFIQEKPDKLLTVLTETGGGFSGGQMQRLAIARCLVRNPDIILLDEATAALDPVNERLVQDTLDQLAAGRQTTLAIAHRLTTIKDSDKIIVIDKGVVVEEGSHLELMDKTILRDLDKDGKKVVLSGFYRNQWETQFNEKVKEFQEGTGDSSVSLPRLQLGNLNKQSHCKVSLAPPPLLQLERAATVA